MNKMTKPTNGWWWLSVLNDGYFEIVQVYSGGKSDFFQRAGVNNFFEIDGKYEFWGPIPEFVPPAEPASEPATESLNSGTSEGILELDDLVSGRLTPDQAGLPAMAFFDKSGHH